MRQKSTFIEAIKRGCKCFTFCTNLDVVLVEDPIYTLKLLLTESVYPNQLSVCTTRKFVKLRYTCVILAVFSSGCTDIA